MNKKLMAVAIAGALAVPGVALAQTSVTIGGFFKVGLENMNVSSAAGGRMSTNQMAVQDNSSRLIFNVAEDLGSGLSAVAQLDIRFSPNSGRTAPTQDQVGNGNTWVGLKSNSLGRLTIGRHDLHYGSAPDDTAAKAGALHAAAISLFDYIQTPQLKGVGAVNTAIATGSRTQNVIRYDMPTWNGVDMIVAWSGNPVGALQGDMTCTPQAAGVACNGATATAGVNSTRKGDGWNIKPTYTNGPFQIGYSYWAAKPDLVNAAGAYSQAQFDQRGDSLFGYYTFGGFKVGLGYNKSTLKTSTGAVVAGYGSGTKVADREVWSLPMSYVWGPHNIVGHYTMARDSKSDIVNTVTSDTGAKMYAIAYVYDLSKRTSLGLTYAKIDNKQNANYFFFTGASFGTIDSVPFAGEKPQIIQATIKHAF